MVIAIPDLTASKTNDAGVSGLVNSVFHWSIEIRNALGTSPAAFTNGQTVLVDNLPSGPTYGGRSRSQRRAELQAH